MNCATFSKMAVFIRSKKKEELKKRGGEKKRRRNLPFRSLFFHFR